MDKGKRTAAIFKTEAEFEEALIKQLQSHGWNDCEVLRYPTEEDLIQNWADILYANNRDMNRLGDVPLSREEMSQVINQVTELHSSVKLNEFILGESVQIRRDNPLAGKNNGRTISLKIFNRRDIRKGISHYQIVQQPKFKARNNILPERRGDIMLLINGMPIFHIELKRSGIPISEACEQIKKYSRENIFTGIFSLVQVFVAMNPEDMVYFANPGANGQFNSDFFFHWADRDNNPIYNWQEVVQKFLYIPMAHQMIGYYTIADKADGILKVMRSYQYYAASAIVNAVDKHVWHEHNQRGGYINHTTGSGKTMTSFKAAQLISSLGKANKVVFLMDRIELGTQSLKEYRNFQNADEEVQATENTKVLVRKLKSDNISDTMIVTSIQKMSNIHSEADGLNDRDIEAMQAKDIVFIIDECHRTTFGDMMIRIKSTFPAALFFGFTGTPIYVENQKENSTTADIFGDELHTYAVADGIRDKNVLGFDPTMVLTFKDKELREAVAMEKAKAKSDADLLASPAKMAVYRRFMDASQVPMAGKEAVSKDIKGVKGIEDYIPQSQYNNPKHWHAVVDNIAENWKHLSQFNLFHGILATSSIKQAIEYYRIFKEKMPELNVSCLFDPNIDNKEDKEIESTGEVDLNAFKEEGLEEILLDYNAKYHSNFSMSKDSFAIYKKDVAARLGHRDQYRGISNTNRAEEQINLLIVVDQMLTGFDSKWVNTLYLDKMLKYENLIQAFSRTNRLYDKNLKPFGIIRYYRKPYTMKKNIDNAVKLYSGEHPKGLFVDKLETNLQNINATMGKIKELFKAYNCDGFQTLPEDEGAKKKFASLMNELNKYVTAAKIQDFSWSKQEYQLNSDGSLYQPEKDSTVSLLDEGGNMDIEFEPDIHKDDEFTGLDFGELPEGPGINAEITGRLGYGLEEDYGFSEGMVAETNEQSVHKTITLDFTEDDYLSLVQRYKDLDNERKKKGNDDVPYDLEPYITEIQTEAIDAEYMEHNFKKWVDGWQQNISDEEMEKLLSELHKNFSILSQEQQKYADIFMHDIQLGKAELTEGKRFMDYVNEYISKADSDRVETMISNLGIGNGDLFRECLSLGLTENNINQYGRFDELKKSVDKEKAARYFLEKTGEQLKGIKLHREIHNTLKNFIINGGKE